MSGFYKVPVVVLISNRYNYSYSVSWTLRGSQLNHVLVYILSPLINRWKCT